MATTARPSLAVYWTSGCGGCEAVFLDLGERLLDVDRNFEIAFFPMLVDCRRGRLEELPDHAVDLSLITGALRTTDDVEMARLLRRVSRTLVAFGACAQLGSVLALADLFPQTTLLDTVYGGPHPNQLHGGDRPLPELTPRVRPVWAVEPVDYSVPGCPPEVERLWEFLQCARPPLMGDGELPEPYSVLGAEETTVCEDCSRSPPEERVERFLRPHLLDPDRSRCLLDQGVVCSGPATRGGCDAPCPAAGAPCRGCYGPPPGVVDSGARMLAALAVIADIGSSDDHDDPLRLQARRVLETVVDPVGSLYRYCFATSLLASLGRPGESP